MFLTNTYLSRNFQHTMTKHKQISKNYIIRNNQTEIMKSNNSKNVLKKLKKKFYALKQYHKVMKLPNYAG